MLWKSVPFSGAGLCLRIWRGATLLRHSPSYTVYRKPAYLRFDLISKSLQRWNESPIVTGLAIPHMGQSVRDQSSPGEDSQSAHSFSSNSLLMCRGMRDQMYCFFKVASPPSALSRASSCNGSLQPIIELLHFPMNGKTENQCSISSQCTVYCQLQCFPFFIGAD